MFPHISDLHSMVVEMVLSNTSSYLLIWILKDSLKSRDVLTQYILRQIKVLSQSQHTVHNVKINLLQNLRGCLYESRVINLCFGN